jgi:hypothetical protein
MKLKEFLSVSKDDVFLLNTSVVLDLAIDGCETRKGIAAEVDICYNRSEKVFEDYGNDEIIEIKPTMEGDKPVTAIQLKTPIEGEIAVEKEEEEPADDTAVEIKVEEDTENTAATTAVVSFDSKKAEELYSDYLEEKKNLEKVKQKKQLDQKQKSWLQQINSAIRDYDSLPEGDLAAMANWYETYNY